jgi:hypothetical protein
MYGVRCDENEIYYDPSIADSPIKVTLDNTTPAYLVAAT